MKCGHVFMYGLDQSTTFDFVCMHRNVDDPLEQGLVRQTRKKADDVFATHKDWETAWTTWKTRMPLTRDPHPNMFVKNVDVSMSVTACLP